jgi:hypothetical protein
MLTVRYNALSVPEIFGHISSELSRALSWRTRNKEYYARSLERAIDIADALKDKCVHEKFLKEVTRFREVLSDLYADTQMYEESLESVLSFTSSFVV